MTQSPDIAGLVADLKRLEKYLREVDGNKSADVVYSAYTALEAQPSPPSRGGDDAIIDAGNAFRNTLVQRADAWQGEVPLWYGWAIMEAFIAGAKHATHQPVPQVTVDEAMVERAAKEVFASCTPFEGVGCCHAPDFVKCKECANDCRLIARDALTAALSREA